MPKKSMEIEFWTDSTGDDTQNFSFLGMLITWFIMSAKDKDLPPESELLEMNGVLDLHEFPPDQVKELVSVWLDECHRLGLRDLRIIHGKGIGVLRTIVHGILEKRDDVAIGMAL